MKKRLWFLGTPVIGALVLMQVMATGAPAQNQPANPVEPSKVRAEGSYPAGLTWNTPFVIQNLGSSTATVLVTFYRISDQTKAKEYSPGTIAAGASLPVRPQNIDGLDTNQKYSVVISADQPVAAVVNEQAKNRFMSYVGARTGGSTIYMPNVTKNYAGFNTPFYVQNVGSVDLTDVTIAFKSFQTGQTTTLSSQKIPQGASLEIDPTAQSTIPDGQQFAVTISSATSGASLAAAVNQIGTAEGQEGAYTGFNAGASTIYAPNIVKGYAGFDSPLVIQNVGTGTATVTVEYYYGQRAASGTSFEDQGLMGKLAKAYTVRTNGDPLTLAAGEAYPERPKLRSDTEIPGGQYAIVVKATGSTIAGIVNQASSDGSLMMTYDAFSSGGRTINLPNITRDYAGFRTPVVVQNIGTAATTVTYKYFFGERRQAGGTFADVGKTGLAMQSTVTIQPGANTPLRPHTESALSGLEGQYSMVLTSDSADIVAIVNQQSDASIGGGGKDGATYEGINP